GTAALRSKQLTVDAPLKDTYIVEAGVLQPCPKIFVGNQCAVGLIVKPTQVPKRQTLQPTYAIVLAVVVEVGMEAADSRNTQSSGSAHRRPSQRPFGCDVHRSGRVMSPGAPQEPSRGHSELQVMIARQRQTANQCSFRINATFGTAGHSPVPRFWMYDRHRMAASQQSPHQMGQGQSDTVYFGRIGLSNDTKVLRIRGGAM